MPNVIPFAFLNVYLAWILKWFYDEILKWFLYLPCYVFNYKLSIYCSALVFKLNIELLENANKDFLRRISPLACVSICLVALFYLETQLQLSCSPPAVRCVDFFKQKSEEIISAISLYFVIDFNRHIFMQQRYTIDEICDIL